MDGGCITVRRSFMTANCSGFEDKTLLPEYDVFDDPR